MTTKTRADQVYVVADSVSFEHNGEPITLHQGKRYRGDDPLVRFRPELFALDGTRLKPPVPAPPPERPSSADIVCGDPIEPLDVAILRRPLRVDTTGNGTIRQLAVGTVLPRDHQLVQSRPDAFEIPKVKR